MKITHCHWQLEHGWVRPIPADCDTPHLILMFADRLLLEQFPDPLQQLKAKFPKAYFIGGSSSGEIVGTNVFDQSLSATLVTFETTQMHTASRPIEKLEDSFVCGAKLAHALPRDGLRHVIVISDGLNVNGSELVAGLLSALPSSATMTGGLCGDGTRFQRSLVLNPDGTLAEGCVSVVGFYGAQLQVGFGSLGGWDPFGPDRVVTKAMGNVLFALDGKPALTIYKKYLGNFASQLPASGLRFPLMLRSSEGAPGVVRTILAVDEDKKSMIFAGDIPEGQTVRFMKANYDRLIDGAMDAAVIAKAEMSTPPQLTLLISCVGRRIVLGQRIEEEIEAVAEVMGPESVQTGFYSYGEIAPFQISADCKLHNQTMTVTTFAERKTKTTT